MMYVRLDKGQDGCTVPLYEHPQPKQEQGELVASNAYDKIDLFLRNNLGDVDYAKYSAALDSIYTTSQQRKPLTDERKDAARYRWLRDISVPPHNFYISVPDEFHSARYQPHEVDAYIDAAIEAAKHRE